MEMQRILPLWSLVGFARLLAALLKVGPAFGISIISLQTTGFIFLTIIKTTKLHIYQRRAQFFDS